MLSITYRRASCSKLAEEPLTSDGQPRRPPARSSGGATTSPDAAPAVSMGFVFRSVATTIGWPRQPANRPRKSRILSLPPSLSCAGGMTPLIFYESKTLLPRSCQQPLAICHRHELTGRSIGNLATRFALHVKGTRFSDPLACRDRTLDPCFFWGYFSAVP